MFPLPNILDLEILDALSNLAQKVDRDVDRFRVRPWRRQCNLFGIVTGTRNKEALITMVEKFPSQPVIYEGFAHQDLVNFTISRRLELSKVAQRRLDKCTSKHTEIVQACSEIEPKKLQVNPGGAASQVHRHGSGSVTVTADTGVLLRRSLRLATKNLPARLPGQIARPVRSPAAKNIIYQSPWKVQRKLQKSLRAAERLSKTSLIQRLESADREMQFDLLGLPAEIRDMILRFVCISSTTIIQPQQQPAIARTCRLLRNEALALYYGCNRFSVFVVPQKVLPGLNGWLWSLQPCYLASVRSLSFIHPCIHIFLDIDFDVRGQKFGIIRRGCDSPSNSKQRLRHYMAETMPTILHPLYVTRIIECVRWGDKLPTGHPYTYTESSSAMLAAFNAAVSKRVRQANMQAPDDSEDAKVKDWKLLSREWTACKGFSASSIRSITLMLAENESDVEDLWVDGFVQ